MVSQVSRPITVAVPTCNGATHLAETLLSILSQEGVPFDLIISDDRSDDETLDVVRAVVGDQARIVVNSERLGLAGNWNQRVALCLTPFIAIVHQDDLLSSGHLAGHLTAFLKDPRVGLVASASTPTPMWEGSARGIVTCWTGTSGYVFHGNGGWRGWPIRPSRLGLTAATKRLDCSGSTERI